MKITVLMYIVLVAVLSCTATFISVRKSDNTTISTEANRDSVNIGGGEWNWEDNDSMNFDRSKDKRHYKGDTIK